MPTKRITPQVQFSMATRRRAAASAHRPEGLMRLDNCNNMDPSGSVLVRHGGGVHGSGKITTTPTSLEGGGYDSGKRANRTATPEGRGLNGQTLLPAGRPTNLGSGRFEAVKEQLTRDDLLLLARFSPKGSLSPFNLRAYCLGP